MNIENKVAVLTGAGNGIGAALAKRMAAAGARGVLVSDLNETDALRVAAEITADGGQAFGIAADVVSEVDIRRLVETAEARFGPVEVFCSNAGIVNEGGVDTPDSKWARSWDINVMAHVYAARAVLPGMLARGSGYLLSTCSAAGLLTSPGAAPYAVTKHAAIALAEWLSITHGDAGIRVSVICPQAVRTKLLEDSINSGNAASGAFAKVGKLLEPDEVAACVMQGIANEIFLILPHPEVQGFAERKLANIDHWLAGMRKFIAKSYSVNSEK